MLPLALTSCPVCGADEPVLGHRCRSTLPPPIVDRPVAEPRAVVRLPPWVTSRRAAIVFWASIVLVILSWWKRDTLPPSSSLAVATHRDPAQTETDRKAFETKIGDTAYQVKPLYRYELTGLVVSAHDTHVFWDYVHRDAGDDLNVADLCVVWGVNALSGSYERASFSSGQYTCFVQWSNGGHGVPFSMAAMGNNHMLTDREDVASAMRSVRAGDQVRFRGWLVEYGNDKGFHRGTSTTRLDTGNGACETVFVDDFEIVARGGGPFRFLFWLGLATAFASLVVWLLAPLRRPA